MEKKTEVIMSIAKAYETKNTNVTDRIEAIILPKNINLNETLKEKLKEIKNTPIDEPELYKAIQEENTFVFRVELFKKVNLNIDDFDAIEVGEFMVAVVNKITDLVDEDGMFKVTPNTVNMKLPKTTQLYDFFKLAESGVDAKIVVAKAYEIAGLVKENLTVWEQQLVEETYISFVNINNDITSFKRAVDKTPFARYIKN